MISEEEFTEAVKVIGDERKKGKPRDELVEMLRVAKYTDMDVKKIMGEVFKEQTTKKKKEAKEELFDLEEYYKYKKEENLLFKSSSVEAIDGKKIDFKKLDFLSRYWMIFSGQLSAKALVDEETTPLNTLLAVTVVSFIENFAWIIHYMIIFLILIVFVPSVVPYSIGMFANLETLVPTAISLAINLVNLVVTSIVGAILLIPIMFIVGLPASLTIFALARLFGGEGKYLPFYLRFMKMMAIIEFGIVIISPLILIAALIAAWLALNFGELGFWIAQAIFIIILLIISFLALRLHTRLIQAYFSIEKFSAIAVMAISLIVWAALIIGALFVIFMLFEAMLTALIPVF
ncbi:MAG: hypothetical protein ABID38_04350 [Candidatus Diapherotrites archaeon]